MTREEAVKIFNTVLSFGKCDCPKNEIEECLKMAIKALEKMPILDKIKAEITNIPITDSDGHFNNWYREPQAIINDVLRIIDKYRTESEVNNG